METYEYTCTETKPLAEKCFYKMDLDLQRNPHFLNALQRSLQVICCENKVIIPTRLRVIISDDRKEIVIKGYIRSTRDFMGCDAKTFRQSTIKLDKSGNMQIITQNSWALDLAEVRKNSDHKTHPSIDALTYDSSEYPTIYSIICGSQIFNKYGVEIAGSAYIDHCPRRDNDYSHLEEETSMHCPQEWFLRDYPSGIKEGAREYTPIRRYYYRIPDKYGLMYAHEKDTINGVTTECFDKSMCDWKEPSLLKPKLKYYLFENGEEEKIPYDIMAVSKRIKSLRELQQMGFLKPEGFIELRELAEIEDVEDILKEDASNIESWLNIRFLSMLNKSDYKNRHREMYDNIMKCVSYGLLYGDDIEAKKNKFAKENFPTLG